MAQPDLSILLPEEWDYDILEDGRIVYFKLEVEETHTLLFQWMPPLDTWKKINEIFSKESNGTLLPYGIEKAYDIAGKLYYLSHTTQQTYRELPCENTLDTNVKSSGKFKEVIISRHPLVGYGFMLSSNPPLFVNHVVPGGPADGKLIRGDLLYCVHGSDVSVHEKTDDFFEALETSLDPKLQISVIPKPKPRYKGRPPPPLPLPFQPQKAKVRFNDPLCEVMCEENGSFIRILTASGTEHVVRVSDVLTFNDVRTTLKHKLNFDLPVNSLGIVATKLSNRMTLPPALLVNQSLLQSRDGWKFHLRISKIPLSLDEFLFRCPASLSYLYSQTCNDITFGFLIPDVFSLSELLAIRIWFEFIRSYSGKSKPKRLNNRSINKLGGFERFLPKLWLEHSTVHSRKDLYKKILHQLSLSKLPSDEISTMLLFLKLCGQHIAAFGGVVFHAQVQFLNKVTRICVSQSLGVSEEKVLINDIKSAPEYKTLIDLCDLNEVFVSEFSRRDDLSKVRVSCLANKELIFILRLYDGCEFGDILQFYYQQRTRNNQILFDTISSSLNKQCVYQQSNPFDSPPSILVDESILCIKPNYEPPSYRSTHLVAPQIWSYFSDSSIFFHNLRHFSPIWYSNNLFKSRYLRSSCTRGSVSHVVESLGGLNEQLQAGLHGDVYFTDSFDEITDSESEEYTLEVPTQFLRESIEKINPLTPDHDCEIDVVECDCSSTNIYSGIFPPIQNLSETGESYDYSGAPNSSIGISAPPRFGGFGESLDRLEVMMNTPPTVSDDLNQTSSFTTDYLPRGASDRSLKSRSDTLLSTTAWHSKYEHLYPRNLSSKPLLFTDFPKANLPQTTHVNEHHTPSSVILFAEDRSQASCAELRSSSYPQLHSFILNTEFTNTFDSFHSLSSSIDEHSPENLSDIEDIYIRPPPDVPITVHTTNSAQNIIDPMTVQIQVVPINTISLELSLPSRQQYVSSSQPIARRDTFGSLLDDNVSLIDTIPTVDTLSARDPHFCFIPPRAMPRSIKRFEKESISHNSSSEVLPLSSTGNTSPSFPVEVNEVMLTSIVTQESQDINLIVSHTSLANQLICHSDSLQSELEYERDLLLEKRSSSESEVDGTVKTQLCNIDNANNISPKCYHEQNRLFEFSVPLNQRQSPQQRTFQQEEFIHLEDSIQSRCENSPDVSKHVLHNPVHPSDSSDDVLVRQISGIETSPSSESSPQDHIIALTRAQRDKQASLDNYAGNAKIRSARSIELLERYPIYQLPHQPPPISDIPFSNISTVLLNPFCNSKENFFKCSIETTPPPIPSTAPPELDETESLISSFLANY